MVDRERVGMRTIFNEKEGDEAAFAGCGWIYGNHLLHYYRTPKTRRRQRAREVSRHVQSLCLRKFAC